jgi:hypothetical protein
VKLFYPNHITGDATFTATNELSTLPGTNVATIHTKRAWKVSTTGAAQVTATLAASQHVGFLGVYRRDAFTFTDFRHGTSPSVYTSVVFASFTTDGLIDWADFAHTTAKTYYEFNYTASAGTESVGVLYASPRVELDQEPDQSLNEELNDTSSHSESYSGEVFSEAGVQYKTFSLSWNNATNTTKEQIETAFNTLGRHTPLFVQLATVSPYSGIRYVQFESEPTFTTSAFQRWGINVKFREAL